MNKHWKREMLGEHAADFERQEKAFVRSRVSLYIFVTSLIYSVVTGQYVFRKLALGQDTYNPKETIYWISLLSAGVVCAVLNRRDLSGRRSKIIGFLFTTALLTSLSGITLIYAQNSIVFVFYFAFALILSALMIPWNVLEIAGLSIFYAAWFLVTYAYVTLVMGHHIISLNRFYPPFDGVVFMGIAWFISFVIRDRDSKRHVHNFALLKRVESQNTQVEKELDLARRVQRTLVPNSVSHECADVWVSHIPVGYVGGDYARYKFLDDNRLLVFISDVTGHGVPAALLVNRVHSEFDRQSQQTVEPSRLLERLNDFIVRDFEGTEMYLSGFCGLLDFGKGTFSYSNYGHPPQYFCQMWRENIQSLRSQTTLLGIPDTGGAKHQSEVPFKAGDRLLLFTDGVLEAKNRAGEEFGEERLKRFIKEQHALSGAHFNERLLAELDHFSSNVFKDDIFVLNIQIKKGGHAQ